MLLSFINMLRVTFCLYVPYGFLRGCEAYVSIKRIEGFLLLEDLPGVSHDHATEGAFDTDRSAIKLNRIPSDQQSNMTEFPNFVTDQEERMVEPTSLVVSILTSKDKIHDNEFVLQDVEFTTTAHGLTVITGPVGSGKSTLLSAIAGEGQGTAGAITHSPSLVYVPQTPWVFSGTIRQNILFGQPYNEAKYFRVIEACCLTEDFQTFPNGDQTIVGERGAILSGGQRSRISLARAVYEDADVYLMDDPLSAVDVKVGQQIFERCIKGLLVKKPRVLTTHREQHMKEADEVIALYKGRMLEKGSFTELKEKGILNTTVDPNYKNPFAHSKYDMGFHYDDKSEVKDRIMPELSGVKELQISDEDREIGVVTFKIYWHYFRSGLHWFAIFAVICLCIITQGVIIAPDAWLSFLSKKTVEDQKNKTNLIIYGFLVLGSFIFATIRAYGFLWASLRCSERLHDKMVVSILQAPVLFFDSNPVGRILNRFSKDIGCLDELLPITFLFSIQLTLVMLASILVPTVTNPWLVFVVLPSAAAVVYISKYYLKISRQLKRLESINRSPVYSHISETLNGLETIRTRGRQKDFMTQFYRYQNVHTQSNIMVITSGRWLAVRMSLLISLLMCAVAVAAILVSQDAAFAGLGLVYVIEAVEHMDFTVRKTSEVENFMTSVERVMTYTQLDYEPGYEREQSSPEHWPREGNITFQDVSMKYYPGGPQVLKNVNLRIKGGTKIGVAGRTGAGKSSLVAALLRMPDAQGVIKIDGVPVKDINLQEARRCISVLGQTPVLFSGSLRKNLDLVEQFPDAELWRALENVQLKKLVEGLEGQLDHELLERGANFSVGERQLICLARVLLQRSKIVILDEPTAHVDPDTEQTIWSIVRGKLKDSTVITIAHRLNTIKDSDMILVMKNGEIDEFDKFDLLHACW